MVGQLTLTAAHAALTALYCVLPAPYRSRAALSDAQGRFRFKSIATGAYTLSAFLPGRGEVHRTIEVGPSTAGAQGRVEVSLQMERIAVRPNRQGTRNAEGATPRRTWRLGGSPRS